MARGRHHAPRDENNMPANVNKDLKRESHGSRSISGASAASADSSSNSETDAYGATQVSPRRETVEGLLAIIEDIKATSRECALTKLLNILRNRMHADEIASCPARLVEALCSSIKKGKESPSNAVISLSLTALTLGNKAGDLIWDRMDLLFLQLKTHTSDTVRVKLAEAISFGVLASPAADTATAAIMLRFAKCFGGQGEGGEADEEQESSQVISACIEAWSLLATTVSDGILLSKRMLVCCAEALVDLLSHTELDVRIAAGEALAIFYEARWRRLREETAKAAQESLDGDKPTEENEELTMDMLFPSMDGVDDDFVLMRVQARATENPKGCSRADRERQWHVFRAVCGTVEHGRAAPEERLRVGGRTVVVQSWGERRRLAALKGLLQGGFQSHFVNNPVLRGLLNQGEEEEKKTIDNVVCELELPPDRPMCHREKFLVHEYKKKARAKDKTHRRDDHTKRMLGDLDSDALG